MGRPKGFVMSEAERERHRELAAAQWAAMSEEEREAKRQRQSEAAKRRWAERTERERKQMGKLISEGRRAAKLKREAEDNG
jgi:hypothetical protein